MPVGSNADRIGWSTRKESLADFDSMMMSRPTVAACVEIRAMAAENFILGSVREPTWSTV